MTDPADGTTTVPYTRDELTHWLVGQDYSKLKGFREIPARVHKPSQRFALRKRSIWPLAFHGEWYFLADFFVVSGHGGSRCFVWIDSYFTLITKVNGKYREVGDVDAFIEQLSQNDRDLLRLYAQGKVDEAVALQEVHRSQKIADLMRM